MKKVLLTMLTLFAACGVWADGISVEKVQIRQGGSASALVYLNTEGTYYSGFSFDVALPQGITCSEMTFQQTTEVDGETVIVDVVGPKGNAGTDISSTAAFVVTSSYIQKEEPQQIRFACYSGAGNPINTTTGSLFVLEIPLTAASTLEAGTTLSGEFTNIHFSTASSKDEAFADASFEIEILAPLVLDENSTTDPEATTGVETFTVKRTVKPNVWNTICFPFDMTAAQLQDIFGGDVELAYLKIDKTNGCYEATYNDDGDVVAINVLFDRADLSEEGLDANYPYLIKTSKEVTEFEMTAAIAPEEVEAEINNGKSGKNKVVYGTFYGTYVAETLVPSHGLFISNNKFWYSTGNTKMKGYRGYFVLNEELASLAENAKIGFSVDGEATSIEGITQPRIVEGVYDLSGRKIQIEGNDLNKLQKGVYIIDGKKVTIK